MGNVFAIPVPLVPQPRDVVHDRLYEILLLLLRVRTLPAPEIRRSPGGGESYLEVNSFLEVPAWESKSVVHSGWTPRGAICGNGKRVLPNTQREGERIHGPVRPVRQFLSKPHFT